MGEIVVIYTLHINKTCVLCNIFFCPKRRGLPIRWGLFTGNKNGRWWRGSINLYEYPVGKLADYTLSDRKIILNEISQFSGEWKKKKKIIYFKGVIATVIKLHAGSSNPERGRYDEFCSIRMGEKYEKLKYSSHKNFSTTWENVDVFSISLFRYYDLCYVDLKNRNIKYITIYNRRTNTCLLYRPTRYTNNNCYDIIIFKIILVV